MHGLVGGVAGGDLVAIYITSDLPLPYSLHLPTHHGARDLNQWPFHSPPAIEMHVAIPASPPILLHTDSKGAQALASTEGTKRSKHIDVRYHHIRELQSLALVSVEGIRSQDYPS